MRSLRTVVLSLVVMLLAAPAARAQLIQHGLVDGNVQIQDSFRLAQVFMEKDREFELVVYPMKDHGWDEEPSFRDSFRRMTEFFDRRLLRE